MQAWGGGRGEDRTVGRRAEGVCKAQICATGAPSRGHKLPLARALQ